MDEHDLVVRARAGDEASFAELFRRYAPEALRAAYLITRDWAAAEDAVQEAFLRAHAALPTFDPGRPWRPWLYRIVTREALRVAERGRRLLPLALVAAPLHLPPAAMEEELAQREEQHRVRAAVLRLPPHLRAAVVLKYFLGFKEVEMAEILGVPVSTVKSRLFAARRALERLLKQEAGD